jgi:hypothetical protein
MGHRRSGTFAYYVSVRDDTQSAFMETPARDALLKLACNSSLTRDASAPQHLPKQEKECIEMDPELYKLKKECNAFRHELIAEYHQLTKARKADPARYDRYRRLQNQVRAKRKKLHTDAKDKMYDNFFEHVGNHIIDQNYQGIPVEFEPDTSHIQPERKVLADLEFKNRDVDTVDDAELVEDRIRSLELRLELHQRNIPKPLRKRVKFETTTKKPDQPPFMMKSSTGLECPVCLGCTSSMHQTARQFAYARKDVLQKHFKTHKLPRTFPKGRQCDIPDCAEFLFTLPQYMLHQAECHKIIL